MPTQFAVFYAASSPAKPLGVWTLAGILALSFGAILIGAIALTTWLDRHRHAEAAATRHVAEQEEKASAR